MNKDPQLVWEEYQKISDPNDNEAIRKFVTDNFDSAGSDIEEWIPEDFQSNPFFLDQILDPNYRKWAYDLNSLWLSLGRKLAPSVAEYPERHSFLRRNYPFIVPGGR